MAPKLPEGETELSWPIGINPSFKPTNRWDIIVWDYFTEDYTLTCPGMMDVSLIVIQALNLEFRENGLKISFNFVLFQDFNPHFPYEHEPSS